jgi:hypothetical protein
MRLVRDIKLVTFDCYGVLALTISRPVLGSADQPFE